MVWLRIVRWSVKIGNPNMIRCHWSACSRQWLEKLFVCSYHINATHLKKAPTFFYWNDKSFSVSLKHILISNFCIHWPDDFLRFKKPFVCAFYTEMMIWDRSYLLCVHSWILYARNGESTHERCITQSQQKMKKQIIAITQKKNNENSENDDDKCGIAVTLGSIPILVPLDFLFYFFFIFMFFIIIFFIVIFFEKVFYLLDSRPKHSYLLHKTFEEYRSLHRIGEWVNDWCKNWDILQFHFMQQIIFGSWNLFNATMQSWTFQFNVNSRHIAENCK